MHKTVAIAVERSTETTTTGLISTSLGLLAMATEPMWQIEGSSASLEEDL